MDNKKIGLFISNLRKEKNMTQKELADKLYVSDKAVSKWERGLSIPDIGLIEKLADYLGVNVSEILKGEKIASMTKNNYDEIVKESIPFFQKRYFKNKIIKIILITMLFILIILPLLILCSGQFLKAPWISFSSFKIMNKANKFYEALQNNDIDTIDKLTTNNVKDQCWMNVSDQTKKNFLDSLKVLKNKRVEYTSFKIKQFRYANKSDVINNYQATSDQSDVSVSVCSLPSKEGFAVTYEICFKDYAEKACTILSFQLEEDDKLIFMSRASDSNLLNALYDKYNPVGTHNIYYNRLHLSVDGVFNGHSIKSIKEGMEYVDF